MNVLFLALPIFSWKNDLSVMGSNTVACGGVWSHFFDCAE